MPEDNYAGSGGQYVTYGMFGMKKILICTESVFFFPGLEYYGDINDASNGFITWAMNGQPTYQMTATAIGPDANAEISQRLISREPMVRNSIFVIRRVVLSFNPPSFLLEYNYESSYFRYINLFESQASSLDQYSALIPFSRRELPTCRSFDTYLSSCLVY